MELFQDARFHDTQSFNKIRMKKQTEISRESQQRIVAEIAEGKLTKTELADKHKVKVSVIYRMAADWKHGSPRLNKRLRK